MEERLKELENLLEEKDSKIKIAGADMVEAHLRIKDQATRISNQNKQIEEAHSILKEAGIHYEHEVKSLKDKVKVEAEKSSKLPPLLFSKIKRNGALSRQLLQALDKLLSLIHI